MGGALVESGLVISAIRKAIADHADGDLWVATGAFMQVFDSAVTPITSIFQRVHSGMGHAQGYAPSMSGLPVRIIEDDNSALAHASLMRGDDVLTQVVIPMPYGFITGTLPAAVASPQPCEDPQWLRGMKDGARLNYEAGVSDERERCAKIAETWQGWNDRSGYDAEEYASEDIAAKIRQQTKGLE